MSPPHKKFSKETFTFVMIKVYAVIVCRGISKADWNVKSGSYTELYMQVKLLNQEIGRRERITKIKKN